MDDDAARFDGSRGGAPRRLTADGIDDQVIGVFRDRPLGRIEDRQAVFGGDGAPRRSGLVSATSIAP